MTPSYIKQLARAKELVDAANEPLRAKTPPQQIYVYFRVDGFTLEREVAVGQVDEKQNGSLACRIIAYGVGTAKICLIHNSDTSICTYDDYRRREKFGGFETFEEKLQDRVYRVAQKHRSMIELLGDVDLDAREYKRGYEHIEYVCFTADADKKTIAADIVKKINGMFHGRGYQYNIIIPDKNKDECPTPVRLRIRVVDPRIVDREKMKVLLTEFRRIS